MDNCGAVRFFDADPDKIISEASARWSGFFNKVQDGPFNNFAYRSSSGWPSACTTGGGSPTKECVAAVKQVCPDGTADCANCLQSHQDALGACTDYGFDQLSAWMCGSSEMVEMAQP